MTEADNAQPIGVGGNFTDSRALFGVEVSMYEAEKRYGDVNPSNPVPQSIPSHFNINEFKVQNRNIMNLPPSSYGIKAGRYSSLRWYGDGPY